MEYVWPPLLLALMLLIVGTQFRDSRRDFALARLTNLERKLDLVMKHLGIEEPRPDMPDVVKYIDRGEMLKAIRAYRDQTGATLGECKKAVEELARQRGHAVR